MAFPVRILVCALDFIVEGGNGTSIPKGPVLI